MAKTPTSPRNKGEAGLALLEAAIALGLVSLIAASAYGIFARAAEASAEAAARLDALAAAENALDLASAPSFLAEVLAEGEALLEGPGWRVAGAPYETPESLLALVRLTAEAGPEGAPIVTLETLRGAAK